MKNVQTQPTESRVRTRRKPFRSSCKATAGGFTLVELMLVLVLIAIMSAMIVPEMKGSLEDSLLRSSARQVIDVFNLTYSRAVSLNQQHRVRLNTRSGQYQVEQQSQEFLVPGTFQPILNENDFQGQIDSRIQITVRPRPPPQDTLADQMPEEDPKLPPFREGINFYPDGTADSCEVVLRDRMGVELVLQINPITATVRILDQETP
jgi:prepilin-type N-terminal cleavage/methylation domain-containing protein